MVYVFQQGDLPRLDLQADRGTDFAAWKAQWHAYISLSGLSGLTQFFKLCQVDNFAKTLFYVDVPKYLLHMEQKILEQEKARY